jgi:TonB family protein
MRTIAAILLLAATPALLAATTYEVRSALHFVTVDVEGEGEEREYAVRVTDQQSGALLVTERLTAARREVRIATDTNLTIFVQASEVGGNLTISLLARNNGTVVDSINASFLTKNRSGILPPPPPPPYPMASPLEGEGVYRVGGDVKAPTVIRRVEPAFPEEARKARIAGIVILEALIDEQGNVQDARVLKPLPFGLDQAALEAIRQWQFRPGTIDAKPVKVIFNLTINFKLPEVEQQ